MPRINFRATDSDFTPYPNDTYLFNVDAVEFQKAQTGNNMINVTFRCEAPNTEFDGRKHWERFVLVPQAGWKLKNFLEAFNVPHTAVPISGGKKGEFEIDFDSDDIVGTKGLIQLEQEIYTVMQKGTNTPQVEPDPDNPGKQRNRTGVRSNAKKFLEIGATA